MDSTADVLRRLYGDTGWPSPFHLLGGLRLVRDGAEPGAAARRVRTTGRKILELMEAQDPITHLLGVSAADVLDENRTAGKRGLAQILLGRAAELAFEDVYRTEMGSQEFELVDLREGRTDTDYRVLNGQRRPLYRIDIKFFGSTFRRAPELVGLAPEDCFPLATYKIFNALKKQEQEHLPYIFLVVFVRALNVDAIGDYIPAAYIDFMALLRRSEKSGLPKRDVEDRAVDRMVADQTQASKRLTSRSGRPLGTCYPPRRPTSCCAACSSTACMRSRSADSRSSFGGQLDMHFSLATDLVPVQKFFDTLRNEGQTMVAVMLERGTI
jgi:hypothetical protein